MGWAATYRYRYSFAANYFDLRNMSVKVHFYRMMPKDTGASTLSRLNADAEFFLSCMRTGAYSVTSPVSYTHLTLPTNREV